MSLNFISAGIFFNWITNFILVFVLMKTNFEFSHVVFSFLLIINLVLWSGIIGFLSAKHDLSGKLNGLFIGVGSSVFLFLVLFLFSPPHLDTNIYIALLWMLMGTFGGWFGSIVTFKKKRPAFFAKS